MTPGPSSAAQAEAQTLNVQRSSPWRWVPSLYLAQGLPNVVVMTVSVIMFKGLGISNTDIALYTSWLYLPWVIKPLWSPVVDICKTRRQWIWVMQLLIGAGLAGVALSLPASHFFQYSLAFLWLLAFSSATHDIAADGFYMLATTPNEQAFFVGIRSTFFRLAMISGQGLLVILAGIIQSNTGLPRIELTVSATHQAIAEQVSFAAVSGNAAELHIVPLATAVSILPEPRNKEEIAAVIATAKKENIARGFYGGTSQPAGGEPAKTESALKEFFGSIGRWLSAPFRYAGRYLETWLRANFSPEQTKSSGLVGNVGAVQLRLSKSPSKEITVTLAQKPGGLFGFFKTASKSISIAEGSRLIFNERNWNQPATVLFQLDPKVRGQLSAIYEVRSGNIALSWSITFLVLTGLFVIFGIYHRWMLPRPKADRPGDADTLVQFLKEFFRTFGAFFSKDRIGVLMLFLLFYRFAEAQLVKMVTPFLLDAREQGGLGLATGQVGFVYGVAGIIALTCGGLLGGFVASRRGLKAWLWPMVFIMHLPDAMFIYLAYAQPENFALINLCVAVEQFGYGFGFTAYMLYMIYIARGRHETAHYAICTGFMALGMMLPGMFSGWLQEIIGYRHFFVWVMLATLPGFLVVAFVPLDPEFGKKKPGQ
jgi:PAT family beta-lactamase induction signal transducer AmpG